MTPIEYQAYVASTSRVDPDYIKALFTEQPNEFNPDPRPRIRGQELLAAVGLAGEAGEFLEHYKKFLFHKKAVHQETLVLEAGDILWYLTLWCEAAGLSLEYLMMRNKEKLDARWAERKGIFANDARAA